MIDYKGSYMEINCPHCKKPFELKLTNFTLECKRCNHTWIPRSDTIPKVCPNPKCKSPYWNRDYVRDMKKKKKG